MVASAGYVFHRVTAEIQVGPPRSKVMYVSDALVTAEKLPSPVTNGVPVVMPRVAPAVKMPRGRLELSKLKTEGGV